MKTSIQSFSCSAKAFVSAVLILVAIRAGAFSATDLSYTPFGKYPVIFVPASLHNLDSLTADVNIFDINWQTNLTSVYSNTMLFSDTTYFEALGSVVADSDDISGSTIYAYRFKYTGYSTIGGDPTLLVLNSKYNGEDFDAASSVFDDCMPYMQCPNMLLVSNVYSYVLDMVSGFSDYDVTFDNMPDHNQYVLKTMMNWLWKNNAPTVANYFTVLSVAEEYIATMPANFCTISTASFGSCSGQQELLDTVKRIMSDLHSLPLDDMGALDSMNNEIAKTFLFHCFNGSHYSSEFGKGDDDSSFLLTLLPHYASLPTLSMLIMFERDSIYEALAYAHDWTYSGSKALGVNYTSPNKFTYVGGFRKANIDAGYRPFASAYVSPADTVIWPNTSVTLVARGGTSYYWPVLEDTASSVTIFPDSGITRYSVEVNNTSGCPDLVYSIVSVNSIPVVEGTSICPYPTPASACQKNSFIVLLWNNNNNVDSFFLDIKFPSAAIASSFALPVIFDRSIISRSTIGDTVRLKIKLDSSYTHAHPDTIRYTVDIPCNIIPDISQGQNIGFNQSYSFSGTTGVHHINGNASSVMSCLITFPFLSNASSNSISQSIGYQQTDTFTVQYRNSGTRDFNGYIKISGDTFSCAEIITTGFIVKIYNADGTRRDSVYQAGFLTGFSAVPPHTIPMGGRITFSEIVTSTKCLDSSCQANFKISWGCNNTDICKTSDLVNRPVSLILNRSTVSPRLVVTRILPAPQPIIGNDNQYVWDASCLNAETEWQFLVYNAEPIGGPTAEHVVVTLINNDTAAFTYIERDSVRRDTGFGGLRAPVFPPQVDAFTIYHFHTPAPSCAAEISNPIMGYTIGSETDTTNNLEIKQGQGFVVRFKTYRCCPDNIDYIKGMEGYNFNHWDLGATCKNNCGEDFEAGGLPLLAYESNTRYTYLSNLANGHISTNQYDGDGPDLMLKQHYEASIYDMTGAKNGCGPIDTFQIQNILFTGDRLEVSDFDSQLFCDSGIAGGGAGITGLHPRGVFRVQFICPANLHMPQSATAFPYITAFDTIWKPAKWNFTNSLCTADFDIEHGWFNSSGDSLLPPKTSGDFREFFQHPSALNFQLQVCCPLGSNAPTQEFTVNTMFNPKPHGGCDSCFIKLSQQSASIQLHCPGCVTPGMIIDKFDLVRTNFGYKDKNDDGLPERDSVTGTLARIPNANYCSFPINTSSSIAGDTLEAVADAHFQDGDANDTSTYGFTYHAWQSAWNTDIDHLYLEMTFNSAVAQIGLKATGLNKLTYIPAASPTTPTDYPLVLTPVQVGDSSYLYHIKLSALSPPIQIDTNDRFVWHIGFTTCINPLMKTAIKSNNQMYLASVALTDSQPYKHLFLLPDSYENKDSLITASDSSNARLIDTSLQVLWVCETYSGGNTVYPIKSTFKEFISDALSCTKSGYNEVSYYIESDGLTNIFDHEYRLMPGIDAWNFSQGPRLTNPVGPVRFHLNVPANYMVKVDGMYTIAPDYRNNHSPIISTISDTSILPRTDTPILGYASINFRVRDSLHLYTPPFASATNYNLTGVTGMNIEPASPPQRQGFGKLVMGDESFTQGIVYHLTPVCHADTNFVTIRDTSIYAVIPRYDSACTASAADIKKQGVHNYDIHTPAIPLNVQLQGQPTFTGNTITYPVNVSIAAGTASNVITYLEIEHPPLPSGIFITSITDPYNHVITPVVITDTANGIATTFNKYNLGELQSGVNYPYDLKFTMTTCKAMGDSTKVRIYYAWDCDDKIADTLPLGSSLCNTPLFKTLFLYPPEVSFSAGNSGVYDMYNCGTVSMSADLYSLQPGGIGEIVASIFIPDTVKISTATGFLVSVRGVNLCPPALSVPTPIHQTYFGVGYNVYVLHLETITSFDTLSASCLHSRVGLNGINNLNSPLHIAWNVRTGSSNNTGCNLDSLSPIWLNFSGIKYCGISDSGACDSCSFQTADNYMTPQINGVPQKIRFRSVCINAKAKELCDGSSTIDTVIVLPGRSRNFTYYWNGSLTAGSIVSPYVMPRIDTVRVVDSLGCIAIATDTVKLPLTVHDSVINTSCTSNTGIVMLTAMGGSRPYLYNWGFGNTSDSIFTGLGAGSYTVIVTDNAPCADTIPFIIDATNAISVNISKTDPTCNKIPDGVLTSGVTGGTGAIVYHWNNNSSDSILRNLTGGNYTITVTDSANCSASASASVYAGNSVCCEAPVLSTAYTLTFTNVKVSAFKAIMNAQFPGLIPGATLDSFNSAIAFNDTLEIDQNFAFSRCPNLTFGPGARILIDSGKILMIHSSHLYACTDYLWRGIEITGANPGQLGGLLRMNNGRNQIDDALYGVDATNGSRFDISLNYFNRCFVGFYFHKKNSGATLASAPAGIPANLNANYFWCARGTTVDTLLKPYIGMTTGLAQPSVSQIYQRGNNVTWAGIHLFFLNQLTITGNPSLANFYGLANGIIAVNCSLTVQKSVMASILPYNYTDTLNSGNGILVRALNATTATYKFMYTGLGNALSSPICFYNCTKGITAINMHTTVTKTRMDCVGNCQNDNSYYGIQVRNSLKGRILLRNNLINVGHMGIWLNNNDPLFGAAIVDNKITVSAKPTSVHPTSEGIRVDENGGPPTSTLNTYSNDTVIVNDSAITGMHFTGVNLFFCTNNVVHLNAPQNSRKGYWFQRCQAFVDSGNYVNSILSSGIVVPNSTHPLEPVGMHYEFNVADPIRSTVHTCNIMEDIYIGMKFSSTNFGAGANKKTHIRANQFNPGTNGSGAVKMYDGLWIDSLATINGQDSAGNQWFGQGTPPFSSSDPTYQNYWAKNDNSNFAIGNQRVRSSQSINSAYWPPNVDPPSGWFVGLSTGNEFDCGLPYMLALVARVLDSTAMAVVNESLTYGRYNAQLQYMNQMMVYKVLNQNTSPFDGKDSLLESFYNLRASSAMGMLETVDSAMNKALLLDSATITFMEHNLDSTHALTLQMMFVDSIMSDSTISDVDMEYWNGELTALQSLYEEQSVLLNSQTHITDSVRRSSLLQIKSINTGVSATNTVEANQKLLNHIYLSTVGDTTKLDSTQLADLLYIAFQCPYTGGYAVFGARSMLALVIDTTYNDDDLCTAEEGMGKWDYAKDGPANIHTEPIKVTMYPNPAKDYALLKFNQPVNETMELTVMDAIGRKVLSTNINAANGYYTINTSTFNNGLYYVYLHGSSGKLFGNKLIILAK